MISVQDVSAVDSFTGIDAYIKLANLRNSASSGSTIRQIINGELVAKLHAETGDLIEKIISNRVENKVTLKNLIRDEDKHLDIEVTDEAKLKQTSLLPAGSTVEAFYASFDDVLTILSLNDDYQGVVIKDENIVNTYNTMFDLLWESGERV